MHVTISLRTTKCLRKVFVRAEGELVEASNVHILHIACFDQHFNSHMMSA